MVRRSMRGAPSVNGRKLVPISGLLRNSRIFLWSYGRFGRPSPDTDRLTVTKQKRPT